MSREHPDGPERAGRATGDKRPHKGPRKRGEGVRPPGSIPGQENAVEAGQATGGDEILRTEHGSGRQAVDGFTQTQGQKIPIEAGGRKRVVGSNRKPAAPGSTDEGYRGWLPSSVVLTPREVLAAVLVAEIGWVMALVILTLAERLAELPEPLARQGFVSALLFGLACGLYVLIRLRSRRSAWRKHLRGEQ